MAYEDLTNNPLTLKILQNFRAECQKIKDELPQRLYLNDSIKRKELAELRILKNELKDQQRKTNELKKTLREKQSACL